MFGESMAFGLSAAPSPGLAEKRNEETEVQATEKAEKAHESKNIKKLQEILEQILRFTASSHGGQN